VSAGCTWWPRGWRLGLVTESALEALYARCATQIDILTFTFVLRDLFINWPRVESSECELGPGSSAGGNLAAAVSLKLRDVGNFRRPAVQVLIMPCLQAIDFRTPSYQQNANNAYLPSHQMANFWMWYARGVDGHKVAPALVKNEHVSSSVKTSEISRYVDHNLIPRRYIGENYAPDAVKNGNEELWNALKPIFTDRYFAPLMASDLAGLPATYIATAQHDVLRDDGILYARRLSSAGVQVEHKHYEHVYHDLFRNHRHNHQSKICLDDLVAFLSSRLWSMQAELFVGGDIWFWWKYLTVCCCNYNLTYFVLSLVININVVYMLKCLWRYIF